MAQNEMKYCGLSIESRKLRGVCVDGSGKMIDSFAEELDSALDAVDRVKEPLSKWQKPLEGCSKLGVAVPGLVAPNGRITHSALIPEHSGLELARSISERTGKEVLLENDANCSAYAELHLGAGRGCTDLFYITLGDGVGGAFIFNGSIWRGAAGFAGEFGYVPIDADGNRLEDMASAAGIVRRTRARLHTDSTTSLAQKGEDNICIDDILAAAEQGDDLAHLMIERTGAYIGVATASVINLLNIEAIVVGGSTMRAGELLLNAMKQRARELSFEPAFDTTKFLSAELGDNSAALGAALLCRNGD
jgi:glucokinase